VRRRAGLERRPHFAHYNNSAKPDCENYYPSGGEAIAVSAKVWEQERRPVKLDALSMRGGVVLERSGAGRFSLYLKLPRLKADAEYPGQVQIQSGLGVRTYSATQLRKSQFVPVIPRLPLVKVTATDQLAGAAAAIEDDISNFRSSGNIFNAGNDGGLLLSPEEPLEWGESYHLFTQQPTLSPPSELRCELIAQGGAQGWHLYEISLPSQIENGPASKYDAISRFLRRAIRHKSARVYLIDPPPHHVERDGTYVYPAFPDRLLLRRTGACETTVEGSARTEHTRVVEFGEWLEIAKLGDGEISVFLDGRLYFSARVDQCGLFRPEGIQVVAGDWSAELFEAGICGELMKRAGNALIVQCQSSRIAQVVRLEKDNWEQRGAHFYQKAVVSKPEIDADNFGSIAWPQIPSSNSPHDQLPQKRTEGARQLWLHSVIARAVGARSSVYLGNPNLIARDLPWLYPYVRQVYKSEVVCHDLPQH
jgi:hypothetical protein